MIMGLRLSRATNNHYSHESKRILILFQVPYDTAQPMTTKRCILALLNDAKHLLMLDARAAVRVSLRHYLAYTASALLFLIAIYLTLPLLREAGSRGPIMVSYDFSLPRDYEVAFSLPWPVPLLAAIFAGWCLAISKRSEYRILRAGHSAVETAVNKLLSGIALRNRDKKRVEALARATGIALRHLSLSVLAIAQLFAVILLLLFLEPLALIFMGFSTLVLTLMFWSAIWPTELTSPADSTTIDPLISHRLRMSNAHRLFATLTPITILIMLVLSRVSDLFKFDLADLFFIALLISVFGNTLSELLQNLLRLQRRGELHQKMLAALCRSDSAQIQELLAAQTAINEESDNDSYSA